MVPPSGVGICVVLLPVGLPALANSVWNEIVESAWTLAVPGVIPQLDGVGVGCGILGGLLHTFGRLFAAPRFV